MWNIINGSCSPSYVSMRIEQHVMKRFIMVREYIDEFRMSMIVTMDENRSRVDDG